MRFSKNAFLAYHSLAKGLVFQISAPLLWSPNWSELAPKSPKASVIVVLPGTSPWKHGGKQPGTGVIAGSLKDPLGAGVSVTPGGDEETAHADTDINASKANKRISVFLPMSYLSPTAVNASNRNPALANPAKRRTRYLTH